MIKENKLKIEYVDIGRLKENEYNPKKMTEKEAIDLERSITEFGVVDPLIVNKAKGREGILVGGHQRLKIYKKLNFKEVPIVWLDISDLKKEKELCLRLTKNTGSWDWDLLANFSEDLLKDVGWLDEELCEIFTPTESLEERKEELKPYTKTHILISFSPEKLIEIEKYLEEIKKIEGIEYEQSSN